MVFPAATVRFSSSKEDFMNNRRQSIQDNAASAGSEVLALRSFVQALRSAQVKMSMAFLSEFSKNHQPPRR